jgi:hypothetical protein
MRFRKKLSATLFTILLLFDVVMGYRFFNHGWPKYVKAGPGDTVQVVHVPFIWEDGLIVIGIALLHVLLIYAFRKSRMVQVH